LFDMPALAASRSMLSSRAARHSRKVFMPSPLSL
jgi:hypothetical protein